MYATLDLQPGGFSLYVLHLKLCLLSHVINPTQTNSNIMITEQYPLPEYPHIKSEEELLARVEKGMPMHSPLSVRYLILHCSATRCNQDYTVEQMERDHKARGFRTVGYHFYVRKDGFVTQHRRLWEVGAHCRPYNRCSIGICYEGGLDEHGNPKDTRTPAQTRALQEMFTKLKSLFPDAVICGHRDLPGTTPKACPCLDAAAVFGNSDR